MNPLNVKSSYYEVMRHYLVIDGKSTKDFGVYLSGDGTFKAPEKNVEEFTIPGRNGTFHYSVPDTYKNVKVPYDCFIFKDFKRNVAAFRSFLLSRKGYVRIEDTHHPDEFRMGMFHEEFDPEVFVDLTAAQFTINFDCRPERWLKSGEETITYTENGEIYNPTDFVAKPILRIYGEVGVNCGINIEPKTGSRTEIAVIIPSEGYVDVDTETMEVYAGNVSYNANLSYHGTNTKREFPVISPGLNGVRFSHGTKLELVPRWWIL